MDNLPDIPVVFPSLPSSRALSVVEEPSQNLLLLRNFLRETRDRLRFTPEQIPIPNDRQLNDLSHGESILILFVCSSLNGLASITKQVDTVTTKLATVQSIVATLPTPSAIDSRLSPISAALRDLSQRANLAPPVPPAPPRPTIPPTEVVTRPAVPPPLPRPRAPPLTKTNNNNTGFESDIPRYEPVSRVFYGNPRAYADKFPDPWEANAFRHGQYPYPSSFVSGNLDPDCPKPQQTYTQAATALAPKKGNKKKNPPTAAKVASVSNSVPKITAPKSLPTAERRFYTPRSSPSEHAQAILIAATSPDLAARVLRDANCTLPLAVTTKVNERGSVTLLVTNTTTPAAAFAPYFHALTTQLNRSFPVGDSSWLPFRLAPNEVELAIHSFPVTFLPEDSKELFPSLADSIYNSKNVRILAARFLNPNAESTVGKTATSVIVSIHPGDVPMRGTSIRHFCRSRTVERAYSSNRYPQCSNCWGFGHVVLRCKSKDPVCPLCSLNHTGAHHRCPNSTCPGSGNLKPLLNCCSSFPARSVNCGEDHSALYRDCSQRPVPPPLRHSPPEAEIVPPPPEDAMDTATDGVVQQAPASPTRSLQQAFEMATPRARRSSTILAL